MRMPVTYKSGRTDASATPASGTRPRWLTEVAPNNDADASPAVVGLADELLEDCCCRGVIQSVTAGRRSLPLRTNTSSVPGAMVGRCEWRSGWSCAGARSSRTAAAGAALACARQRQPGSSVVRHATRPHAQRHRSFHAAITDRGRLCWQPVEVD